MDHRNFKYADSVSGDSICPGISMKKRFAYFHDQQRRVDFVLAFQHTPLESRQDSELPWNLPKDARSRRVFERNLCLKGLELEYVDGEYCNDTRFILIHVPFEILCQHAEHLGMEMRVRTDLRPSRNVEKGCLNNLIDQVDLLKFDEAIMKLIDGPKNQYHPFSFDELECFVGHENVETFFSSADRIYIAYDILCRTRFGPTKDVGIELMLQEGIYDAAYPLHEWLDYGEVRSEFFCKKSVRTPEELSRYNTRELLYWLWTKVRNCCKFQPLFLIKEYFGSKVALYFAFVGYYTRFLIPCSIFGVLCFLFGVFTLHIDIPSNEICASADGLKDVLMCPVCDRWCDYTKLSSSCIYSKLSYISDNISTVVYAIIMSVGATLFVEGCKRNNSDVAWRLGLLDTTSHEEGMRLAYLLQSLRVSNVRDPLTKKRKPAAIPFSKRLPKMCFSSAVVIFYLFLVLIVVGGTIVYRIVVLQILYRINRMMPFAKVLSALSSSILNLVIILIMNYFYTYLALKLTDWEYPRTQSEFEESYTVKVILFQTINWYSFVFYTAFYKGTFSGLPGRRIFGLRSEDCDPAGCMVELVISIATIMLGKTLYNILMEFLNPVFLTLFRVRTLKISESRSRYHERYRRQVKREMNTVFHKVPRWEWDYALTPAYEQFLFDEYIDTVIQFGFVTLFASAFPLAPFIALLNNLLEVRLDAYSVTVAMRRSVPHSARGIGLWLKIIDVIGKAAVLTNAFVIAFTSDFIPQLVYKFHNSNLTGYIYDRLSIFEPSTLYPADWSKWKNATKCWFRDYREPPCSLSPEIDCDDKYNVSDMWWKVLAFRLGFVIIFASDSKSSPECIHSQAIGGGNAIAVASLWFYNLHVVLIMKGIISYMIPDVPSRIFVELERKRSLSLDRSSYASSQSNLRRFSFSN